ncbi:uncharacterized protein EV420DRAFT_1487184 [Desarmillaria tabescens]|uniref:Uncharacterized protein n=1 Tax=Armillaria tabescens TaxID=1929756 RepID=A0AA39MKJ6_ARMTA|nr:uncharacterized protein EV420DRAFT_1487184 [Desarmillaria tabescens]KAK0437283.1 hypothetical protein EV420DRAFT_1487184 [Desarmillaria tabescens]
MPPTRSVSKSSDRFTPPPSPDTALALEKCLYDTQRSLDFVKNRAIRHLVTITGVMMNVWTYPAWRQENGVLVPVSVENLRQYMLEWDVTPPNCLCPLKDPSSALVQTILRQGDDGKWRFLCASDYCGYEVDLSKVFGPGLPQTALQNYAVGSQDIENMDYWKYEQRWEEHHGKAWNQIACNLSDIDEGLEYTSDDPNRRYSSRVPDSEEEPEENSGQTDDVRDVTSQTTKVPVVDLAAVEKKSAARREPVNRIYKKLRSQWDNEDKEPVSAGQQKDVPGRIVKAVPVPAPAPPAPEKEVQVKAFTMAPATQGPARQEVGVQTAAVMSTDRSGRAESRSLELLIFGSSWGNRGGAFYAYSEVLGLW